ncbi:MAG TPA: hypothetical protein DEA91_19155 [Paenibacillus sp.]|nr:hypothetical protein [Paenibacillus sp.]
MYYNRIMGEKRKNDTLLEHQHSGETYIIPLYNTEFLISENDIFTICSILYNVNVSASINAIDNNSIDNDAHSMMRMFSSLPIRRGCRDA